jgi:Uma2 family endonuclease
MVIEEQSITLEAFLRLPERKPALEFEAGVVTQKVSPKGPHSRLQSKLVEWFNRAGEPGKLALAFTELRTTFAGASLVPDLAVYRWERIPRDAAGRIAHDFTDPPDIAIEIASPGQSRPALVRRCRRHLQRGVPIALLMDPDAEWVREFRAGGHDRVLRGADRIDLSDVIPGLHFVVQEIFDLLYLS